MTSGLGVVLSTALFRVVVVVVAQEGVEGVVAGAGVEVLVAKATTCLTVSRMMAWTPAEML